MKKTKMNALFYNILNIKPLYGWCMGVFKKKSCATHNVLHKKSLERQYAYLKYIWNNSLIFQI